MIAWATDPRAELTMVANAVAMNSALPRPHSARQPTISATVSDIPLLFCWLCDYFDRLSVLLRIAPTPAGQAGQPQRASADPPHRNHSR
jgi:hypothetical protein